MTHELWTDPRPEGYGHGADGRGGGWPGLAQVVLVRVTRHFIAQIPRKPVVEKHFYLTSLPPSHKDGGPERLLAIARGHWEIENGLHWVKDATMGEDACRCRRGAHALAWLRSIALFLLGLVEGDSTPQKMEAVRARPGLALELVRARRRPRKLKR